MGTDRGYRLRRQKFGYYDSEERLFGEARAFLPDGYPSDAQSVEAAIMDVADDITYALHDLEDFYLADIFTPGLVHQASGAAHSSSDHPGQAALQSPPPEDDDAELDGQRRLAALARKLAADHPERFDAYEFQKAVAGAVGHVDQWFPPVHNDIERRIRAQIFIKERTMFRS